jgi:hypothetical protein
MKIWLVIGCLSALAAATPAQDKAAPIAKPEIQTPRPATNSALNTNALSTATQKVREPLIKYSGVATDFKRSTNRWKFFSLRQPRDPKHDGENVIRTTRTEAGGPIKIFSIDF